MQQHTAEHILSGIIHTLYGFDNVGFHLGPDEVTMDVSAPMDAQMIARVEREANLAVFGNLPVEAFFPTEKELENITYRSKSELTENIRIVTVAGVDCCACCAPHVKSTGEIGLIKILKRESLRGGVRLWIAAGERAYRDYIERARETERISALLSAPVNEVFSAVNALNESLKELKADNRRLEAALTERIADGFVYTEGNAVLYLPELSIDALRSLSKLILDKVSGVLVLLCGKEGDFKYVLSSKSSDLRVAIKDYNSALGGKGGGRSEMVQGSFTATLEEIKEYFK
jgi:alanyl-tRNA synthetase